MTKIIVSVRMEEDLAEILRSKLYGQIADVVDSALREFFESRDEAAKKMKEERESKEWDSAIAKYAAQKKQEKEVLDAEVKP